MARFVHRRVTVSKERTGINPEFAYVLVGPADPGPAAPTTIDVLLTKDGSDEHVQTITVDSGGLLEAIKRGLSGLRDKHAGMYVFPRSEPGNPKYD